MSRHQCFVVFAMMVLALAGEPYAAGQDAEDSLRMSMPVLCRKVYGFASFEEWPGSTFTADDKLMIYSEPSGYKIEHKPDGYRAHLVEDARLRKKGDKVAIWKKENMLEYEAKSKTPPYQIYLRTDLAIKGLPPGEYELDLTLRDRLSKDEVKVMRTLPITIVSPESKDKKEGSEARP